MTPTDLEKLCRIDAHLERLLTLASKRTPGEFYHREFRAHDQNSRQVATAMSPDFSNDQCVHNAAFIASCAGNAEAGWKATRAAIQQGTWLIEMDQQGRLSLQDQGTTCHMLLEILAAFPNI